jgi:hypothetical protein
VKPEDRGLAVKAGYLQRRAPQEWDEFLESLRFFAEKEITDLVYADSRHTPVAQGRAQALSELALRLKEAPNILLKIEKNGISS